MINAIVAENRNEMNSLRNVIKEYKETIEYLSGEIENKNKSK